MIFHLWGYFFEFPSVFETVGGWQERLDSGSSTPQRFCFRTDGKKTKMVTWKLKQIWWTTVLRNVRGNSWGGRACIVLSSVCSPVSYSGNFSHHRHHTVVVCTLYISFICILRSSSSISHDRDFLIYFITKATVSAFCLRTDLTCQSERSIGWVMAAEPCSRAHDSRMLVVLMQVLKDAVTVSCWSYTGNVQLQHLQSSIQKYHSQQQVWCITVIAVSRGVW